MYRAFIQYLYTDDVDLPPEDAIGTAVTIRSRAPLVRVAEPDPEPESDLVGRSVIHLISPDVYSEYEDSF